MTGDKRELPAPLEELKRSSTPQEDLIFPASALPLAGIKMKPQNHLSWQDPTPSLPNSLHYSHLSHHPPPHDHQTCYSCESATKRTPGPQTMWTSPFLTLVLCQHPLLTSEIPYYICRITQPILSKISIILSLLRTMPFTSTVTKSEDAASPAAPLNGGHLPPHTPYQQPDWRWDNSSLLLTTSSDLSSSQIRTPELCILHHHTVPLIPLCHSHLHWAPSPHISTLIPQRFLLLAHCHSGEGDGTPLQYSCLESPMDGGAWWAAVHGVAKSHTQLSNFTFTFHFHALEKAMATHSSVLAWRIPGTEEPDGLPSMGSHRVGHDWSDLAAAAAALPL